MHRDPPHYLKQLKTTRTPRRFMWLACRGTVTKKRGNYENHFQVAALGHTWWTARANKRKDEIHTYESPADLWSMVGERIPVGRRVVLFAYDLATEMRLSQLLTHLPQLGWSLDKIVLERTAAWCLLRNGRRSLMCCDLRSWAPVEWDKIVRDIVGVTGDSIVYPAGTEFAASVVKTRAHVIRDATLQICNWIEGENLGQFRPTGSGQAYAAYRRRFIGDRILIHDDMDRLAHERHAMYTGRAEAWKHGGLHGGPYVEYDLHAAYCHIGAECEVPVRARGALGGMSNARLQKAMERWRVLAHVTVDTDVECLPASVGGRTLWPVGRFDTWLWDPEIRLALQYANSVRVNRAYTYARGYAIRDFCGYVLDGMGNQSQVYGEVPKRVLKHWSRCLVGRLGLRYRTWHKFGPQVPPDVRLVTYLDADDGTRSELLLAGSQRLLLGDMAESPESCPQIPGWVMSECRSRLWRKMVDCSPDVAYVDTDSIIVQAGGDRNAHLEFEGDPLDHAWVRKGVYDLLTIHGPRNLEVGVSRRVSGLPLSAVKTGELEYSGEVMRSLKQSMRGGTFDRVVSMPREFRLQALDYRRMHLADGSTQPFRLEEPCS